MALNARQKIAYKHLCNIYSVTRSITESTGKPGAETFTLMSSALSCLYEYTDNIDAAIEGMGQVKRPTIFTTDRVHVEANTNVKDGWIVKDLSLLPDGVTHSPTYGTVHRVKGA